MPIEGQLPVTHDHKCLSTSCSIFFSGGSHDAPREEDHDHVADQDTDDDELRGLAGVYNNARHTQTTRDRVMLTYWTLLALASLAMLVLLALTLLLPRLKTVRLLGHPLWKWTLQGVTLTAGYIAALVTAVITTNIMALVGKKSTASHNINGGLMVHITRFMYVLNVLVGWHVLLGKEKGSFEKVTWIIVSIWVGSLLFVLKQLVVMKWSANSIYRRLEPRILIASVKYYFIGLVAVDFREDAIVDGLDVLRLLRHKSEANSDKLAYVSRYIMSRKTELGHLVYVCRILKSLAETQSPILNRDEEDDNDVIQWFKRKINGNTPRRALDDQLNRYFPKSAPQANQTVVEAQPASATIIETLPSNLGVVEATSSTTSTDQPTDRRDLKLAHLLFFLVSEETTDDKITFDDLIKWMVHAHKDCMNMGRTLVDASEIVTRLDLMTSCVIILIVILLGVLLTGYASTAVLISIATPLLAWTVLFGDTAKSFFQGLVFCFGTHSFDIGDRCVFDDYELEVKLMNVLTTTFIKIGSKEKMVYPNAVLATKLIQNFGWQPDPCDIVELKLNSSTNLEALKEKITQFFSGTCKNGEQLERLMIKEFGSDYVTVKIHYKLVLDIDDLSHSQCSKKKSILRSKLLNVIRIYVNVPEH